MSWLQHTTAWNIFHLISYPPWVQTHHTCSSSHTLLPLVLRLECPFPPLRVSRPYSPSRSLLWSHFLHGELVRISTTSCCNKPPHDLKNLAHSKFISPFNCSPLQVAGLWGCVHWRRWGEGVLLSATTGTQILSFVNVTVINTSHPSSPLKWEGA